MIRDPNADGSRLAAAPLSLTAAAAPPAQPVGAELLTIGAELLLGETVDSNAGRLARGLGSIGIPVRRTVSVGDEVAAIAAAVAEALSRSPLLLTTGGLGPTQDDPTREAVALATGRPLEFRPELWEQVQARFRAFGRRPTANNRQQAYVPAGAIALENPVGTAPAFILEAGQGAVVCLPGVPREMEALLADAVLPWLRQRFGLTAARCLRVLHTVGAGESQIDERIRDMQLLAAPTVGLAAHAGQVDVRITAWAASPDEAAAQVAPVEADVRSRLGPWIYGADDDSLASVLLGLLDSQGWRMAVLEAGLGGALLAEVLPAARAHPQAARFEGRALAGGLDAAALADRGEALRQELGVDALLAASLQAVPDASPRLLAWIRLPTGTWRAEARHGGPPAHAPRRAALSALALARAGVLGLVAPEEEGR